MDVSDFFFLLGKGEGGVQGARRGGGRFFIENPRMGGISWSELGNLRVGRGANYFFSGPKSPPRNVLYDLLKARQPFQLEVSTPREGSKIAAAGSSHDQSRAALRRADALRLGWNLPACQMCSFRV